MSLLIRRVPAALQTLAVNDTSGALEAVAAVPGQVIRVWGFSGTFDGASTLTVKSGATALSGPMSLLGFDFPRPWGRPTSDCAFPHWVTAVGEALNLTFLNGVRLAGTLYYEVGAAD